MTTETPEIQTETLAQRLTRGPLEPEAALDILRRVLKTLAFRHWSGVVHGGITPKTIVIASDGQVALTGFRTRAGDDEPPAAPVTRTPADPAYMAPEQINRGLTGARADVFALGVIAYEMITGTHPFGAGAGVPASEVASRIVNGLIPPIPTALLTRLPAYVGPALKTALATDLKLRFASAESFLAALTDPKPQTKTVIPPSATMRGATPPGHRRRWLRYYALPAATAIVVLVVVLLVLAYAKGTADVPETTTTSGAAASTSLPTTVTSVTSTTATTAPPTTTTSPTTSTTLPPAPVTTRYEETTAGIVYTGAWTAGADTAQSGGHFERTNTAGGAVTATFNGTYLAWVAKKSPAYGEAKVTLDGTTTFTVDLYDANTLYQQKVWDTGVLSAGLHTVKLEWTGTKNAAATAANINVDALDVAGSLVSFTRFEQTNALFVWAGAWTTTTAGAASGGSFRYANASGASVTIDFTGESLTLVAKKGPDYGEAKVTLDGTATFTVDLYSATDEFGVAAWSSGLLPAGDHSVAVEWTGAQNAASTGTNINLDAVDVIGTLR